MTIPGLYENINLLFIDLQKEFTQKNLVEMSHFLA